MSAEEKESGAARAAWQPVPGGQPIQPVFVQRQARNLTLLRDLLEEALKSKQKDLERAQMALARLKHGGGM